jgi:hypothetical protein
MKNRTSITQLILRLLLVTATLILATHSAWAGDQVPFKGKAKGAVVNAVPEATGVLLTVHAVGRATHLGFFFREETLHFNPAAGTIDGTVIFTAANGDQLFGNVVGGFVSPTQATGTYEFTGGTGHFANASGEADFVVTTPDGTNFTADFEGKISYTASKKK